MPRFNLGEYKDFLAGAVRSVEAARQLNRQAYGSGAPGDLPRFPGSKETPETYSYLTVFSIRYPDGIVSDAVVEVRSDRPLSGRSLRDQATTLMAGRLSIVSFPGDRGTSGEVVGYRVISAYRGAMP